MNPYVGAPVVVNVDASHNNGHSLAAATITGLNEDGTVNVRVWYDVPPHLLHRHARQHLDGIQFHDTSDPAEAGKHGLHGAFWPASPQQQDLTEIQQEIATILTNQEKIMSGLDDLQAANTAQAAAITAMQAEWTTFLADIKAALANADSDAAIESAAQLVEQQTAAIQAQTAAMQAADPANAAAPAPAEPAPAAPAEGTAGSTVAAGDGGSAA